MIPKTEAVAILHLCEQWACSAEAQAKVNRFAIDWGLATPHNDARVIIRRVKSFAAGVINDTLETKTVED